MTDRSDEMRRLLLAALPGLAHAAEDDLATDELGRDQDAVA